jgi:hypothetical protein
MNEDLETFTRTMVIERLVVGALVGLTPGAALKLFGLSEDDNTPALRYVGRIFGIRNAILGVMLWEARRDPAQLERMATLNAVTEAIDAVYGRAARPAGRASTARLRPRSRLPCR